MTVPAWRIPGWPAASRDVPSPSPVSALGEDFAVDLFEAASAPVGVVLQYPGARATRDLVAAVLVENQIAERAAERRRVLNRRSDREIWGPVGNIADGRSDCRETSCRRRQNTDAAGFV